MDIQTISYCKIFPPIGIARVGDSQFLEIDKGWFIGPEFDEKRQVDFSHKDVLNKVKRQAARFRLYAFDENDAPLGEFNDTHGEIMWNVELVNKKAAWFKFKGSTNALSIFEGDEKGFEIRNSKIGQIDYNPTKRGYEVCQERKKVLEIHGGKKYITGKSVFNGPTFIGKFKEKADVFLGELKTDEYGRLIVLGGRGTSNAVNDSGENITQESWIRNYANNDNWYDDVSDGPVNASININNQNIEVRGGAWIVVAPPDFAPDVKSMVSLYDVMEEVSTYNSLLISAEENSLKHIENASIKEHIAPFLSSFHQLRWVNSRSLKGHGPGAAGDFQNGNNEMAFMNELFPESPELDTPKGIAIRKKIFEHLRRPTYSYSKNFQKQIDLYNTTEAILQANSTYMPPLSGDEGDLSDGDPSTWMTVTHLQYERLKYWTVNPYDNEVVQKKSLLELEIENLTKCTLRNTTGGPFYPGIELTSICRSPNLYSEPFRVNGNLFEAGDLTKYMAVPWQADIWECKQHWWPAHRPDNVITDEQFESLFDKFSEEVGENYEKILNTRCDWDRGLGVRSRPSDSYLNERILPVFESTSIENYISIISGKFDKSDDIDEKTILKQVYFDSMRKIILREISFDLSDIPSPWRMQFRWQEKLDLYSGLYFHLKISSPEDWISAAPFLQIKGTAFGHSDLSEIKSDWGFFKTGKPTAAKQVLQEYTSFLENEICDNIHKILQEFLNVNFSEALGKVTIQQFIKSFKTSVKKLEEEKYIYTDFTDINPKYKILRAVQLVEICRDILYKQASNFSGDMEMVSNWSKLGFVVKHEFEWFDTVNQKTRKNTIQIEKGRSKYEGESFRDYFYYLMNIQEYPDFIPYSIQLVEDQLKLAQNLIDKIGIDAPMHPEAPIQYSKNVFDAKMDEIYRIVKSQAETAKGWRTDRTREMVVQSMRENPVFNQTDGTWLRFVANSGPLDEISSVLSEIWADETGNGNPALHHGNIYTTILRSVGIYLPDLNTKEYAYHPDIHESSYISTVFQLAISQHSGSYFPEILGMTLFLEWEVLSIVPKIKRNEFLGIDTQYMILHVGIDNAIEGHGAKAKLAVELYLDEVLNKSGQQAMQREWERIWRGAIAFSISTSGYGYFGKDLSISSKYRPSIEEEVKSMIKSLTRYGSVNHFGKSLGGHRINDLFDEPEIFVKKLAGSPFISRGKPEESLLLTHLTSFNGPMFKVFDSNRMQIWREWISWLGHEGDTESPKTYISKAKSMFLLLSELQLLAMSSRGHKTYSVGGTYSEDNKFHANKIAQYFERGDLIGLMQAFKEENNGWVVPFMPDESPLIVDFAGAGRPMGAMLDRIYPRIGNQIGRVIIIKWIEAGCPLPGEEELLQEVTPPSKVWQGKQLLIQQVGMGAVH